MLELPRRLPPSRECLLGVDELPSLFVTHLSDNHKMSLKLLILLILQHLQLKINPSVAIAYFSVP